MMFSTPTTMGWMPYWIKRKKAKPSGGMKSRKEFWKPSSSN